MILWRPVGMRELELVWEASMAAFPPRLVQQPIFYPVLNEGYAVRIACEWNATEAPFVGYVTRFEVSDSYGGRFDRHVVGDRQCEELWVPSEQLPEFNANLLGPIEVEAAFFGVGFVGCVPERFILAGRDAVHQFQTLAYLREYSGMDFQMEIGANALSVFLNFPFWLASSSEQLDVSSDVRVDVLESIRTAWGFAERPARLIGTSERGLTKVSS